MNLLECLEDRTIEKETYKDRIAELNLEFKDNEKKLYEVESKVNDIGKINGFIGQLAKVIADNLKASGFAARS